MSTEKEGWTWRENLDQPVCWRTLARHLGPFLLPWRAPTLLCPQRAALSVEIKATWSQGGGALEARTAEKVV